MAARSGNLQCPFDTLLPFHVGKIVLVMVEVVCKFGAGVDDSGFHHLLPIQVVDNLFDILGSVYLQIVDYGGFAGVLLGDDDAFELLLAGLDGYG